MSGRLLGGRYRLQQVLGRGGMAVVWRGVDERLDRPVAIKMLDRPGPVDPAGRRFDREARTVARLAHPAIVAVYDAGTEDGVPYLVMELVDGPSLAVLLAEGPMQVGRAVAIAEQVCTALEVAHAAGVVHRDVKPGNVLITPDGGVKVCDFGIARLARADQPSLTGPAAVVGTSDYMAPEQAAGSPVDARTDLYALGCLLYAMLTGGPPFTGDSPLSVVWQHRHQPPRPLASVRPDVPAKLAVLVHQLLAKNPADRPSGAAQVRAGLGGLSGQPARPVPPAGAGVTGAADPSPVRARAAVLSPTRTMPALDPGDGPPAPAGGRFRLGPSGVAAVALVAAVLAAVAVAALLTTARSGPQGGPAGTAATSLPATASPAVQPTGPTHAIAALRSAVQAQVQAGQLDPDAARDLDRQLDEVARELAKGRTGKAADKAADLRGRLGELREDGRLTGSGYDAILASLGPLIQVLPPADDDN